MQSLEKYAPGPVLKGITYKLENLGAVKKLQNRPKKPNKRTPDVKLKAEGKNSLSSLSQNCGKFQNCQNIYVHMYYVRGKKQLF